MGIENENTATLETRMKIEAPVEVYAGSNFSIRVQTSVPASRIDLRGRSILITGPDVGMKANSVISAFDGKVNETDEIVLPAPTSAGKYTWLAALDVQEIDGVCCEETTAEVSIVVKPVRTDIVVWDVPATVTVGERFNIKAGIRSSDSCDLTGALVEIFNHEGKSVAASEIQSNPWPGTTALYFTEIALLAADSEGLFKWIARSPQSDTNLAREKASKTFRVRTVSKPECTVRVEAYNNDDQVPAERVHVLMQPYRAVTNEHGVAELKVPKGSYLLHVTGQKFNPFRAEIDVDKDLNVRAELSVEVPYEQL